MQCWLLASCAVESLKVHSIIVSGQLLLADVVCGKTSEFHGHAHDNTWFAVKWVSLLEAIVWDIMTVNKALWNGKILILACLPQARKASPRRRNCFLYVMGGGQCNQLATRCHVEAQHWFLRLAAWDLQWWCPCQPWRGEVHGKHRQSLHLCHSSRCTQEPTEQTGGSGEKGLPASTEGHLVHLLIERLLCSKCHSVSIRTGHGHSLCQSWEAEAHTGFPPHPPVSQCWNAPAFGPYLSLYPHSLSWWPNLVSCL